MTGSAWLKRPLAVMLALAGLLTVRDVANEGEQPKAAGRGYVAVRAGTMYLVEDGVVLEGGATILAKDGRIQSVGKEIAIPADALVVDYGPDAVIVPGLVAPSSAYGWGAPAARTAEPGLSALDNFEFTSSNAIVLSGGVTTSYIGPSEGRLIAGHGAMVKLAGANRDARVISRVAAIHGAIDGTARGQPGYWEPPIPATSDVGIGYQEPQLPRTAMGALVALEELLSAAQGKAPTQTYGRYAPAELATLVDAKVPWRMIVGDRAEARAILGFTSRHALSLVIVGGDELGSLASEIAAAGAGVVYRAPFAGSAQGVDRGKGEDTEWPTFDAPSKLVKAGVRVAIAASSPRDELFAAALASRGGLDPAAALRAITLTPAELYGAAGRVGSLRAGKDADFVVLNGPPLSGVASVLATYSDGALVWKPQAPHVPKGERSKTRGSVVIVVDELHVGDGTVLRPGEVLIQDGKIVEVSARVSRTSGCTVVRGKSAMPGIVDALGHLGLDGATSGPGLETPLAPIVAPGDDVDRKVAARGVTTVVLSPRSFSSNGVPLMAYKPAEEEFERQVLGDPVGAGLSWSNRNRAKSGEQVLQVLERAKAYRQKWIEYEEALAKWVPEAEKPVEDQASGAAEGEPKEGEAGAEGKSSDEAPKDGEAKPDEKSGEAKDGEKSEDSKKKKKKKDGEEELEADPITGVWQAQVGASGDSPGQSLKMRLKLVPGTGSGDVEGNLRSTALGGDLIDLKGHWNRDEKKLKLSGLGVRGWIVIEAEPKEAKLAAKAVVQGETVEFTAERTSKEYVIATRPERRAPKEDEAKEPKGKPKAPRLDPRLEPFRRAMDGRASVLVEVERADEIRNCVHAFASYGITPVLVGASDAGLVIEAIKGKVAGVLLSPTIVRFDAKTGTTPRVPYAELQSAGIPIAFHSSAEEGAIDLPIVAAYAISQGMSASGALRALTHDAARLLSIDARVGRIAVGLDGDVLVLDGAPLAPPTRVLRAFVNGVEMTSGGAQ